MKTLLTDTKMATKIIVPLILIALIGLAGTVYAGVQLKIADSAYSRLVNKKAAGSLAMTRMTRNLQRIGYDTYKVGAYGASTPEGREALDDLDTLYGLTHERVQEAETLMPVWKDELSAFKPRIDQVIDLSKRSVGQRALRSSDAAMTYNAEMDRLVSSVTADVQKWNDGNIAANRAESDVLTKKAGFTFLTTLGVLLAATVMAVLGSLMITSKGITGPLGELRELMARLANADFEVDVTGQDRKDEVGQMAKTVQVFKANGIRARDLDAEATRLREQSERERAIVAREQEKVVSQLADGLSRLSEGDLAFTLNERFGEEYEKLRSDFNAAMSKLKQTMQTVSGNTHGIRGGADEISQAADDLSRRTEQQAASLEETAAALDEITATVRTTAENANEARRVVAEASESAKHSGEVVGQAVEAMSKIEKSSQQISQIIGVIDEIAFQTNLLALNAGVEAARAGDAGRGFAVVASEVRALAQRSAEAAKEIKTLISASSTQVDQGVSLVAETGTALKGIVEQVARINHLVADIAASAQEQATGLQQVNTAVNQMDQVTQQNAAMVEESTAASHSLAQETEQLSRLIGQFRTGDAPSEATAPRKRPIHNAAPQRAPAAHIAMKTTGYGGAARKPQPQTAEEGWEEF